MSLWLSGIGVSRGIAIGRAQRLHADDLEVTEINLDPAEVEGEVVRFFGAQRRAKEQLREVRAKIPLGTPGDIAAFIDTHLLMIDDRSITEATVARIRSHRCNAEAALRHARDALVQVFDQMEDPYLRTRRDDVEHVCNRVLRVLLKQDRTLASPAASGSEPTVIVSDDITPADIILLAQQSVVAFVTEYGGPLSHTAILARSLGVPTVVGLHSARRLLREGEILIVDGDAGHVIADPEALALTFYRRRQQQQQRDRQRLTTLRDKRAESKDGVSIRLLANLETPEDAAVAVRDGAEGVGLYRTEIAFMNRGGMPGEDEQYEVYARAVSAMPGPITMRTLDLGADKHIDSVRNPSKSTNPALGLRAIRLCLKDQSLFRAQLRALLRASVHGHMRILLPMISSAAEFRQAAAVVFSCRDELRQQGVPVADDVELGAMIEVPAAAVAAPMIARQAGFFSIGTNDLIQYTLAIDRVDDEVTYLYDPLHPAVLQMIGMTIEAGRRAGIEVGMCGEMAADPRYTRLLLGLGLESFSMHPGGLLEVKSVIRESSVSALRDEVAGIMGRLAQGDDAGAELERLVRGAS
jgi:phosphotransferase system enzyme I (PtsI)